MFKRTFLTFVVMLVFAPQAIKADFYRYTDNKGNIVFTDDLSSVPDDQRQMVEKYHEAPPSLNVEKLTDKSKPGPDFKNDQTNILSREEMSLKKKELEKKQSELEKEYEALMEEKKRLEKQKDEAKGRKEIKEYNKQVLIFSDRLNQYNEKRTTLEKDVNEYNSALEKATKNSEK